MAITFGSSAEETIYIYLTAETIKRLTNPSPVLSQRQKMQATYFFPKEPRRSRHQENLNCEQGEILIHSRHVQAIQDDDVGG